MALWYLFLVSCWLQTCSLSSATFDTLKQGKYLSVEKWNDVLISENGVFSAGFFPVGDNAFCFAIWINISTDPTVVWTANRDQPVNGRRSKFSLLKSGNLILLDAAKIIIWSTNTASVFPVQLQLLNSGNLIVRTSESNFSVLWQSFEWPTNTLLPEQHLTRNTSLISSKSQTDWSSGPYKFYFDNDNVLHLLFQSPEVSSRYWPLPWLSNYEAGRTEYNDSRVAVFNSTGYFSSSDDFNFSSVDVGIKCLRRLILEHDGNLRLYSLKNNGTWVVSWQLSSHPCRAHGICGPNSICTYDPVIGRRCTCIPGYKAKIPTDWSSGCETEFPPPCEPNNGFSFTKLSHVVFYGYDEYYFTNYSFEECKNLCLQKCSCKGFQYKFNQGEGYYECFAKVLLYNGMLSPAFDGDIYLKLPKLLGTTFSGNILDKAVRLNCPREIYRRINVTYPQTHENGSLKVLLWLAIVLGGLEFIFIFLGCCFLFKADQDYQVAKQGNYLAATSFKRFTYAELKKATCGFTKEIGKGGGGIVYKGKLSDQRVAAIKELHAPNRVEAEFLAEVSTIGRFNHMNMIELWGYCAEGKHRLLVYEFMKHGSLADNLSSNTLNWERRLEIALGTARGLCYLHEECLERLLHCDIKLQNILLDADYNPKVADFGMSKLLNRSGLNNSRFSRIRGTRGYMAPEWVYNLPITSKVDIYSYGIVVLEMLTGKSPTGVQTHHIGGLTENRLVTWVKEKMDGAASRDLWIEEIVDPMMGTDYDKDKIELLVKVALQCAEQDASARPTMKQVLQMMNNQDKKLAFFPV